jgi:orotate phosphoribosyltransferase
MKEWEEEVVRRHISERVKVAVERAGVRIEGHFVFANGGHSDVKLEMDKLRDSPEELDAVLELLSKYGASLQPDVILGVPSGGQWLADEVTRLGLLEKPVAALERIPGGAKQDFRFRSEADAVLAAGASKIVVYEDVVSTMSSVAGVVKLLDPVGQDIHSVAIWRRGVLLPEFLQGVTPHFLVEEEIPTYEESECPVCSSG